MDLIKLTEIAINAAQAAAKVIQNYTANMVNVQIKEGGTSYASKVVTAVDLACEQVIQSHLMASCQEYDFALLTEETEDNGSRFEKAFFWCVDPMDGTLAFINKRQGYSVAIALVAKDGTPYIGVVLDPSTNTLYHAIRGKGAYKNGQPWQITCTNTYLTYVTDRTLKETPKSEEIERFLHKEMTQLNLHGINEMAGAGAVLNAILVLEHGPACMLKLPKNEAGGGSIWDYAATTCIYHELGCTATNYAGNKLDLNRKSSSFMNHEGVFFANVNR